MTYTRFTIHFLTDILNENALNDHEDLDKLLEMFLIHEFLNVS